MSETPAPGNGLTDALVQTAFVTMAALTRAAADSDLSLTQLRVLGILRDRRLRMTELAGFLGLEKSTLSGLVDRAERRGLLARAPAASDRRAVEVFITPAGAELSARAAADITAALGPLTAALAPADRRRLQDLLEAMLAPASPP